MKNNPRPLRRRVKVSIKVVKEYKPEIMVKLTRVQARAILRPLADPDMIKAFHEALYGKVKNDEA